MTPARTEPTGTTSPAQRVVLVTGVAGQLGGRVARRLAEHPDVAHVVGVDVRPPRPDLGPVRFVRADIRTPVVAKVLAVEDVDTVVHTGALDQPLRGGRSAVKETNVIGSMQLLAACQRADRVRRLVLVSSTSVYGAAPADPGVIAETATPKRPPRSGYAKDCTEIETYVSGFGRRRPDVALTVLRCADVLGQGSKARLARYLRLSAVPTVLGFDPRLQLLHAQDALAVVCRAAVRDMPGTYNVAGDGVVSLSQAIRRLGRVPVPVPSFALPALARTLERTAQIDLSSDQVGFLTWGRVVDTSALAAFDCAPQWSTARTLEDFACETGAGPLPAERVRRVEQAVLAGLRDRESDGG